jgi:uncharacterized protein with PQ loop repeat
MCAGLVMATKEEDSQNAGQRVVKVLPIVEESAEGENDLALVVAKVAMFASFIVTCSPVGFFLNLIKTKGEFIKASNKQVVLYIPYLLLSAQALLWTMNGFVERSIKYEDAAGKMENVTGVIKSVEILLVNGIQAVVFTAFVLVFVHYSAKEQRMELLRASAVVYLIVLNLCVCGLKRYWDFQSALTDAEGSFYIKSSEQALLDAHAGLSFGAGFIANVGCMVNMLLYAAPFLQLVEVWKTGDIDVFPMSLCAASAISTACWSYYGYLINNNAFVVQNLVGCVASVLQLVIIGYLYMKFGVAILRDCEKSKEDQIANSKKTDLFFLRRKINLKAATYMREKVNFGNKLNFRSDSYLDGDDDVCDKLLPRFSGETVPFAVGRGVSVRGVACKPLVDVPDYNTCKRPTSYQTYQIN